MEKQLLIDLLKREMLPAMGCTEPAAAALAGARARDELGFPVEKVSIFASRDMVKNAMGVGLPSCSLKGIQAAVALGVSGGSVSDSLGILSRISSTQISKASSLPVHLSLVNDVPPLYVKVTVFGSGHTASAAISGEHDRFSLISKDNIDSVSLPLDVPKHSSDSFDPSCLSLDDIIEFASSVSASEVSFVLEAVQINMAIAKHSISGEFGLQVGKTALQGMNEEPHSLVEAFEMAASLAAAGSDARMSGCPMPVVINSGSGNQGITVTVPVAVVASFLKCSEEHLAKALCISQLVALVLTARKNRLSALCGAFTASIGTACAYVYLLGGDRKMMDNAVNTMVGNLTGIICDGAKNTCALKIYSCLEAAALSVRLAYKGFAPSSESGIVGKDSLQSIDFLSRISSEGMEETDKTILSIMMDKQC